MPQGLKKITSFGAHWLSLIIAIFTGMFFAFFIWGGLNTEALASLLKANTFFIWTGLGGTAVIALIMQLLQKSLKQTMLFSMHWLALILVIFAVTGIAFLMASGFNISATKTLLSENSWFIWVGIAGTAVIAYAIDTHSHKTQK